MASKASRPFFWMLIGSALIAAISYHMAIQSLPVSRLSSLLGLSAPGGVWRLLAIIFALLNLKSLPFAWHVRIFYGLLRHVSWFKHRQPEKHDPSLLFQPLITSTTCSLLEMDYNLHKSNSTYFADLDMSRMHLMACIMRRGLHKVHFGYLPPLVGEGKKSRFNIMFGGVQCTFRREIKPGQSYEIWTRVLSWDRKWLYLVSHIVKKGAVKPKGYSLQPWKKVAGSRKAAASTGTVESGQANGSAGPKSTVHPAILATSVSKYVFKEGRITIPPEIALEHSDLLPPRPAGRKAAVPEESGTDTPSGTVNASENAAMQLSAALSADDTKTKKKEEEEDEVAAAAAAAATAAHGLPGLEVDAPGVWDWDAVEAERLRGWQLAQHMAGLDAAADAWTADETMALGEF